MSGMASSIVESRIARGGRPCSGRFLARMYWTPPQPASALAAGRASRVVASSAASHTYRVERLTRRPSLPAGPDPRSMLFPTVQFAIFYPLVLGISWLLMPRPTFWKPFILVASYIFYAYANWKFCLLLGGITLGNQAAALLIGRTEDERRRKWIMGVAVALALAVLGVFKSYAFFVQDVGDVLDAIHLGLPIPLL